MVPPFMFIISCLYFFPKYCKYVVVPGVYHDNWNSFSITFFANKHEYAINKEWRQEAISFRLQKETSCLSNLEHFGFKFQRSYIMATTTFPVPVIVFTNCFA